MTREEFASQCERGAAMASPWPVSAGVLRWTAAELRRGEPAWWKAIAKAWDKRRFNIWSEPVWLYLAALHFEALNDAESPLVRFFPSCGGTGEADPGSGVARFMADMPPSFLANLKNRERRSLFSHQPIFWLRAAALFFQRRGLPYYLVELNAGAGVNLAADVLFPVQGFDSSLIAARIGLDHTPLDFSDLTQRRWFTAAVPPDFLPGIAVLDAAMDAFEKRRRSEAAFVQIVECPTEKAPAFLAKNVPADDPDVGLLIFNGGMTSRMNDADYAAFVASVSQTLKPWGNRALWIEAELVRGETYSTTIQVRARRFVGDQLREAALACIDLTQGWRPFDAEANAFLTV